MSHFIIFFLNLQMSHQEQEGYHHSKGLTALRKTLQNSAWMSYLPTAPMTCFWCRPALSTHQQLWRELWSPIKGPRLWSSWATSSIPGLQWVLSNEFISTGFLSEIGTKLRNWAFGQAGGSCYSRAAKHCPQMTQRRCRDIFVRWKWGNLST